ncbi:MAG: helix-turn-helix domain-containing protein [Candidatus Freyarchaeota archaeon]|nr:helix-turn-helix domain-containing protein [Candidatus Jordarchaeia archaeon]
MLNKRMGCLEHPVRQEVYRWVCENPGAYFFEIANQLSIPTGTLAWHLRVLEAEGLLEKIKFGGRVIFYPKYLRDAKLEKALLLLRNKNARKIFDIIAANPGISQSDIVERFGLHHDTVRWHIKRMVKAGLVRVKREGRSSKYHLGEAGEAVVNNDIRKISPNFVQFLLDRLHGERLRPELKCLEGSTLVIKIKPVEPYEDERMLTIDLSKFSL